MAPTLPTRQLDRRQLGWKFGCVMPVVANVVNVAWSRWPWHRWRVGYGGLALFSKSTPQDCCHFQTWSLQPQPRLTQNGIYCVAPFGAQKLVSQIRQKYLSRPVNRLWCGKSVLFPFNSFPCIILKITHDKSSFLKHVMNIKTPACHEAIVMEAAKSIHTSKKCQELSTSGLSGIVWHWRELWLHILSQKVKNG